LIQQLGKPRRILQKEPAHHCLKSRRPAVEPGLAGPGSATSPVAATPHPIELLVTEYGFELLKGQGLGIGANRSHHGPMQVGAAARALALAQALMQFPHGIPQPGELEGTQFWAAKGVWQP